MATNQFAALTGAQSQNGSAFNGGGGGGKNNGRRPRTGGVAGATLKRAGLVDEDLGMRDVSSAGPSRAQRGRGQAREGNKTRSGGNQSSQKARLRANPMGARPGGSQDPMVTGQAFGIRGAGRGGKGKGPMPVSDLIKNGNGKRGRVPGGGGNSGDSLLTRMNNSGGSSTTQHTTGKTVSTLKAFLNSRFNVDAQFLNLEAMSSDQILLKEDIKAPGTAGAHKDIGSVMWKLSREMFPNLITVSLARNDLKSLIPVTTLPEFLPNLKNLSLQNNDIKWVKDLSFHHVNSRATAKFKQLQELILTDNPVHDNAVSAGNEQGYRAEILARFPTLTMLDQKPVSQTEHGFAQLPGSSASKKDQVGIAQGAANAGVELREFPLSIPNGNFVDEHAESIVPPFLAKYFELFDNDRSSLRSAYSNDATFTIVTSPAVPPRARWQNYINTMPRQRDLQWKAYKEIVSHNIMQLGVRPANKGFPRGQGAIVGTFNKLPKTTHPLTDPAKFAFDAWLLPNNQINATMSSADGQSTKPDALLFISVHGEFAEAPSQGVRSFSRCFVVAPVLPGSTAANLGWPCVIISDQLTVRQYAGTAAWNKGASGNTAAPATGSQQQQQQQQPGNVPAHLQNIQPAAGLSAEQHSMSIQLATQTGLTYPFAVQCLNENAWNAQLAFERFQALKANGSIPPQAFATVS
ncbi:uncharacterized protein FA14DRAFT_190982 [Meira miltonrushii]|uniref:mRNA export factor MEX67 n=1 Tax=Meira miltonrushii TaxID=1280837 RepID=A0A316V8F2_9BASI|nr:uncharacterized protein FA14DRAFT_190982 [Meira miltonrushii]PWN33869.1 hypothetical protein FA14DRAFT_190982 [Meira miltonrushii]